MGNIETSKLSTDTLWTAAHEALMGGYDFVAMCALRQLALRWDIRDALCTPEAYGVTNRPLAKLVEQYNHRVMAG